MEDLKKKFNVWIEKQEYFKKLEDSKKRRAILKKKEDEIERMKLKMSETIY
jgi:hypothetical protein